MRPQPSRLDQVLAPAAAALASTLNTIAARAMEDPEPDPPRCIVDHRHAPWRAWVDYFETDDVTTPRHVEVALCSQHADQYHHDHRSRGLTFRGRPVIRLVLTQR